jgi:CheY-like chemotaxis protein
MLNHPIAGRRVLVVEDDYMLAIDLAGMLSDRGADVIGPVGNVAAALAWVHEGLDAAVLDFRLGGETSRLIADELSRDGTPYIYLTGSIADLDPDHGAAAVCAKPAADRDVLDALVAALQVENVANKPASALIDSRL